MITDRDCKRCYGCGYTSGPYGSMTQCTRCNGSGIIYGRNTIIACMVVLAVCAAVLYYMIS